MDPVHLGVPAAKGPLRIGTSAAGEQQPVGEVGRLGTHRARGEEAEPQGHRRGPNAQTRSRTANRRWRQPGRWGERVVLPSVKFVPQEEFPDDAHPYGITWDPVSCTVLVSDQFKPYVREVGRWVESTTLPRDMVVTAVRQGLRNGVRHTRRRCEWPGQASPEASRGRRAQGRRRALQRGARSGVVTSSDQAAPRRGSEGGGLTSALLTLAPVNGRCLNRVLKVTGVRPSSLPTVFDGCRRT